MYKHLNSAQRYEKNFEYANSGGGLCLKKVCRERRVGGRPDGRAVEGAMGFEWMERAVEGRKEEQDGKAVSKYNLDAMDEGRSPMEGQKEEQDGKAVSKSYLDAMNEGRIITINAGLVGLAFMFI